MNLLIRNVTVIDPNSSLNGKLLDLYISNGVLKDVGQGLDVKKARVFEAKGAVVSPGWMDIGVQACDPGYEHREDLESLSEAAMAGGFTAIATFPNTHPVSDSKSGVLYVKNNTSDWLVDFFPIGAISLENKGEEITEMMDMYAAGAIAFSDGDHAVQHDGVMLKALQYVKAFDGIILNQPLEKTIAPGGLMHEAFVSTSLGMKGIPSIAEELMVHRDIYLAEYSDSKLHLSNVSTKGSVELIRIAKKKGIKVTASVSVMNLGFLDDALSDFETNYKVLPPLRSAEDREALIEGLMDGTIDLINSNHIPVDEEGKNLEFPYADFGAITLECAFAAANTFLQNRLKLEELVNRLAVLPREIMGMEAPTIEKGKVVNMVLFDPKKVWKFGKSDIRSKSENSPFLDQELIGRVIAVFNNRQSFFVDSL